MLIFAGVDGTGPSSNRQYDADFAHSHVRTIYKNWHHGAAFYLRGPRATGWSTWQRGDRAAFAVRNWWKEFDGSPNSDKVGVFLAGYSRGGAAVISAAEKLKNWNIPVHCLILFDAVDRTHSVNADTIPSNVAHCYHAVRDPRAESRGWFGNCGRRYSGSTKYKEQKFDGTHGALGGCPWGNAGSSGFIEEPNDPWDSQRLKTITRSWPANDKNISSRVWNWMSHHMVWRKRDFPSYYTISSAKGKGQPEGHPQFGYYMVPE